MERKYAIYNKEKLPKLYEAVGLEIRKIGKYFAGLKCQACSWRGSYQEAIDGQKIGADFDFLSCPKCHTPEPEEVLLRTVSMEGE